MEFAKIAPAEDELLLAIGAWDTGSWVTTTLKGNVGKWWFGAIAGRHVSQEERRKRSLRKKKCHVCALAVLCLLLNRLNPHPNLPGNLRHIW